MKTDRLSAPPRRRLAFRAVLAASAAAALGACVAWAAQSGRPGYTDTPFLPGGKWRVHDPERPHPRVVEPGTASTQDTPGRPPADAVVLFDGSDLSKWRAGNGGAAGWKIENGEMVVPPRGTAGAGPIYTRDRFGDCQIHLEFATPSPPKGTGQSRGNSGLFLADGHYEIQILDSYRNETYPDGQAAALYAQYPPLVNASRKPGEWQTYDILYTAPRFKEDGTLAKPGYITLLHNGVVVHNHAEILGTMRHKTLPRYQPHPEKGILSLQDHGSPVRFRNIWVRELKGYDQP